MPRLLLLLLLLGALLVSASAKPRFNSKRNGTRATGTSTTSALKARQLTRERVFERTDKLVMANLFGREDCSIPQPSTGVCTCGPPYQLCGPQCVNTNRNVNNCGGCAQQCESGANPGCCGGVCSDFNSALTCGGCDNTCASGESCCGGACVDLTGNHDNCGACGNPCGADELCCNSQCIAQDETNCGVCGHSCLDGDECCGGTCYDLLFSDSHCRSCDVVCPINTYCFYGDCEDFAKR
ncbi:hypothetical protein EXIGLDRAFT_705363 [Exidia glandulosa HHB12029]|uniref:Stig1-domain-containing protein n=1 Tax=Exidia glandulosa HHB12029 TaxID=1314781 RepID=A0A165KN37_EXIGL|nr:hypothetical protein EXIGLDRAFT_705363 [Exidia glandulosa HHB12029]